MELPAAVSRLIAVSWICIVLLLESTTAFLFWVVFFHIHFMTSSIRVVLALWTIRCRNGNKFWLDKFSSWKIITRKPVANWISDPRLPHPCSWIAYRSFYCSCISAQSQNSNVLCFYNFLQYSTLMFKLYFYAADFGILYWVKKCYFQYW